MQGNTKKPLNKEVRYLRFLNETLQANVLREKICDEFTRKIFDYLEDAPTFDGQIFCAFLYKFIYKCELKKSLLITSIDNVYEAIRKEPKNIANDLGIFLRLFTVKFALPSVDPNQFTVSLKEKLSNFLDLDEPTWKKPQVKIIVPEMRGNTGMVPYYDLEFTLPKLKTEQLLDILHFTICALNYLSQRNEPEQFFSNPEISSTILVSKPEHFKVISDSLLIVRKNVISSAFREKEYPENDLEFDESLPDVARIIRAQKQDPKIEKQWLDENSSVFSSIEDESTVTNLDEKLENSLTKRQWLIAMRFFINHFNLRHIDAINFARLLTVLNGGKNLQDFRTKLNNEKGLITERTKEDAEQVAKLCRENNLDKVADDIENAISRINTNYL